MVDFTKIEPFPFMRTSVYTFHDRTISSASNRYLWIKPKCILSEYEWNVKTIKKISLVILI